MKTIEITVSPKGDTKVQTRGFTGGDCLAAGKFLEQALGVATSDVKTADYYQAQIAEQNLNQPQ